MVVGWPWSHERPLRAPWPQAGAPAAMDLAYLGELGLDPAKEEERRTVGVGDHGGDEGQRRP